MLLLNILLLNILLLSLLPLLLWVVASRYTDRRVVDQGAQLYVAWQEATAPDQQRAYLFWFLFSRRASASRRVWRLGYRRFCRKLVRTIPRAVKEAGLSALFLAEAWGYLAYEYTDNLVVYLQTRSADRPYSYGL